MAAEQQALLMASGGTLGPPICVADQYYSCDGGASPRTVLFLHADETPPVDDSCANTKTVTLTGTADVSTVEKKFGASSFFIQNNGTSTLNGVVVNDHTDFDFGTQDFTIELWAYRTSNAREGYLFWYSEAGGEFSARVTPAGTLTVWYSTSGGPNIRSGLVTLPLNQWNLLTIQRRSACFWVYLNGVPVDEVDVPGGASATVNSAGNWFIGRTNASSAINWQGYIDEVRVTRGVARYGLIDPPTAAFPTNRTGDVYQSAFDNSVADTSPAANVATLPNGGTFVTSPVKFGSHALQLNGTNQYVKLTNNASLRPQTVLTVEGWFRTANISAGQFLFAFNAFVGTTNRVRVSQFNGSLSLQVGTVEVNSIPVGFVNNTWFHVALVFENQRGVLFVNGVPYAYAFFSGTFSAYDRYTIGGIENDGVANSVWSGQIDDFRYSNGVANYPIGFDPASLPNCDGTFPLTPPPPVSGTAAITGTSLTASIGSVGNPSKTAALSGQLIFSQRGSLSVPAYPTFRGDGYGVAIGQYYLSGPAPAIGVWFRPDGGIAFAYERNGVSSPWFVRPSNQGWLNFTNSPYTPAQVVDKYRFAYINYVRGVPFNPNTSITVQSGATMADGVIIWYRNGIPNFTNYQVQFFVVIEVGPGHPAFGQPNQIFVTYGQTSIGLQIDNYADPTAPPVESGF